MKKFFSLILLVQLALLGYGQAKKPKIMVVPSRQWCIAKGYITSFDNFGVIERVPDYQRAFDENPSLALVVSKINTLYTDRGFELIDLSNTLASLKRNSAEDAAMNMDRASDGKGEMAESLYDKVRNAAKADIIIEIQWTVNTSGPQRSVTYIMRGLDAYSDKQIAGAEGTGPSSMSSDMPKQLEEAVLTNIDNFNARLQAHFDRLFADGREIKVEFRRDKNWSKNFESEYGSDELSFLIEDWLTKNTVKGRYTTDDATENKLVFSQVRIPMFDDNQRALDARAYGRTIQKFLRGAPFNIEAKLVTRGQGYLIVLCGQK